MPPSTHRRSGPAPALTRQDSVRDELDAERPSRHQQQRRLHPIAKIRRRDHVRAEATIPVWRLDRLVGPRTSRCRSPGQPDLHTSGVPESLSPKRRPAPRHLAVRSRARPARPALRYQDGELEGRSTPMWNRLPWPWATVDRPTGRHRSGTRPSRRRRRIPSSARSGGPERGSTRRTSLAAPTTTAESDAGSPTSTPPPAPGKGAQRSGVEPVRRDGQGRRPGVGGHTAGHDSLVRPGVPARSGPAVGEMVGAHDQHREAAHPRGRRVEAAATAARDQAPAPPTRPPARHRPHTRLPMHTAANVMTTIAEEVATVSGADHCHPMVSWPRWRKQT